MVNAILRNVEEGQDINKAIKEINSTAHLIYEIKGLSALVFRKSLISFVIDFSVQMAHKNNVSSINKMHCKIL